ncbi:MAG: hypothetical protein ABTQ30_15130 [Rhizobiaceae bacterium]
MQYEHLALVRTFRHVKRGSCYREIARAELQASRPLREGDTLVVYAGDDGKVWCRLDIEFDDGRFEEVHSNTDAVAPSLSTEPIP